MIDKLENIHTRRAILLVMDYQPAILSRLEDDSELLARMAAVIAQAREAEIRVGYVRVAFAESDYAAIPATNQMFAGLASARLMSDQDPATHVHEALAPATGDIVVRKTRVGAFSTTDLHEQLRKSGIDTIILAGISTSGVVLSTVRDGAALDYRIIVISDCCYDPDPAVHEFLISKIFPQQAAIIDSAAFAEFAGKEKKSEK